MPRVTLILRNPLAKYSDPIYSVMRFVVGFLFCCHGAQKLFGVLGGETVWPRPLMVVAGLIEFIGGSLVAVGLFTPVVAFITSGEMAVAYFLVHARRGFWPILNHGEGAVFYCFVFLFIAASGDGPWSLGTLLRKRRTSNDVQK